MTESQARTLFTRPVFDPPQAAADMLTVSPDPQPYVFGDPQIVAAVNVALVTRRPLLVTGPPGSGKSALAEAVAVTLNWSYLEVQVTSRTELTDFTAGFDAVRRLADAQASHTMLGRWAYVEPGALWWAFDPTSAARRGRPVGTPEPDDLPTPADPRLRSPRTHPRAASDTVVLIDEIDKVEPDLPNDLLGPVDRLRFDVPEAGRIEAQHRVLLVVTSNGERRLPSAFLRRCVVLDLAPPSVELLKAIARHRLGVTDEGFLAQAVHAFDYYRAEAVDEARRLPSTAEFLDAVVACQELGVVPAFGTPGWRAVATASVWKGGPLPDGAGTGWSHDDLPF